MSLKISVVIPVYNRVKPLFRALDSVYAQSYPAHEVIVVDDGSEFEVNHRLADRYAGIQILRLTHSGVSRARNQGVRHANGQWIAFLDSDDEWHPDKLAQQKDYVSNSAVKLVHSDEIWIRNGVRVNPHKKHQKSAADIFFRSLELCLISPSAVLIEKQFFHTIGGFDETLPACEDYDLWLRVTSKYTIGFIDKPLITKHGGHVDQLSKKYWGMDRFRVHALEKLYHSRQLSAQQEYAVLTNLVKKCQILCQGAEKHNNVACLSEFSTKLTLYQQLLHNMMSQLDNNSIDNHIKKS